MWAQLVEGRAARAAPTNASPPPRTEDDVIFPAYREFFPNLTADADKQHHELEEAADT